MPVKRDEFGRFVAGSGSSGGFFGAKTKVSAFKAKQIADAASRAQYENIRHALFSISKDAKSTISKSEEPSEPGEPPTTRGKGGRNIRGAIFVDADKESGIAGPRKSFVGESGEAHEFGGRFKGQTFDERAFMGPALERNTDRFASGWAGSIGE